jgi:acetyl esterase
MSGNDANSQLGEDRDIDAPVPNEEIVQYFEQNPADDTDGVTNISLLREQTREVGLRVRGELEAVKAVADVEVSGIAVRTYRPETLSNPDVAFVWVHGGGWMHGDLDVYDGVARAFANELGCEVIAVDYGLAPEHPFPDGFDDVWKVVTWANSEFDNVVVAGDSSGANIAAAVAINARDQGIRLAAQLLIYPVLESSDLTPFKQRFRTRYSPFVGQAQFGEATHERIKWIWDVYVPSDELRRSPLATPMRATSLRGVAPAVIITAEHDILRGEAEDYAARLKADDVPVQLINFPGQIHGFLQMRGVLAEAHSSLRTASAAVDRILHPEPARTALAPTPSVSSHGHTKTKES